MSETQISFFEDQQAPFKVEFIGLREAGLKRLADFAPYMGRAYASSRNFDLGEGNRSNISALSPWIRHRIISEEEVIGECLKQHSFKASEKFIQEVFWRSYFKGWLEQRPDVWHWYKEGLQNGIQQLEKDGSINQRYQEAILGQTGIEAFDHWALELVKTGYLHNHARMWFASIWIFTLQLPWELGADFFYRHLMDGDPASNTCSWRWVGGLHTKGKSYAASASNIERFTNGRFSANTNLAKDPMPLHETKEAKLCPPPKTDIMSGDPFVLLISEEDGSSETLPLSGKPTQVFGLLATDARSPLSIGKPAKNFAKQSLQDALTRAGNAFECKTQLPRDIDFENKLLDYLQAHNIKSVVTAYAPLGPVAEKLTQIKTALGKHDIKLVQILRNYDAITWPHTTKGFFKLKKKIPELINALGVG